ncbi:DUF488 domain-containing protein [Candidatus Bathyarchaeota archaeon]|nr:DUF488 domain-containing protein [Candidatus Bathyarchaeota archaeon]
MTPNKIFTIGYGGKKPDDFFKELDGLNPDIVVDVRENPFKAYLNCYTKNSLENHLKEKYVWIRELGNKTRTLPPTLVDEEEGLKKLKQILQTHSTVILLCAEKEEENCHRNYIKKKIEQNQM